MDVNMRCVEPLEHNTLGDLRYGDSFQYEDWIWIKVDPRMTVGSDSRQVIDMQGPFAVVVRLDEGFLEAMPKSVEVRRVNAFDVNLKPDYRE